MLKVSTGFACLALLSCASHVGENPATGRAPTATANNATVLSPSSPKQEYRDAVLPYEPLARCQPTEPQLKLADLAAAAIEMADDNSLSLKIGAEQYLALQPCLGSDTLRRVQVVWETNEAAFRKFRLVEYQLELASRLPSPNDDIVRAVANSAFNAQPQSSQFLSYQDIRPFARAILARHFATRIQQYGKVAYEQILVETSLGTGAAQVAAAAGYPGTLRRIANLMDEALANYPLGGTTMPHERYKRLVELLWAFEVAGPDGHEYVEKYCVALQRYWWRGSASGPPRCLAAPGQLRGESVFNEPEPTK